MRKTLKRIEEWFAATNDSLGMLLFFLVLVGGIVLAAILK